MYDIKKCQKIINSQGAIYLGESTKEKSVGYLELNAYSSLTIHNRLGGIENLIQVIGSSVVIVFDKPEGTNYILKNTKKICIKPGI